jgi:molybdopterin/thiamine biosynthesis adenylyltransferase/rhodanese-related sulfurtransferase
VADSFRDRYKDIQDKIKELGPKEVAELLENSDEDVTLIDVREREEYEQGAIPGAKFIPRGFLDVKIEREVPNKDQTLVLHCAGGVRSAMAAYDIQEIGYKNVISMTGGYNQWEELGLPTQNPETMTDEQRDRYSRHTKIPEIEEEGQQKLLNSKVLLLGAGGLGSPTGFYLAAAGVGTLGIVDDDVVERSNLQRQILHTDEDVGEPKVESATRRINALNPDVNVNQHPVRLEDDNADDIVSDYDLVVDGADNFPTRYTLNRAALKNDVPVVHGSIFRFEGQVTTFLPDSGPCYKCLFPEPTPDEMAPG